MGEGDRERETGRQRQRERERIGDKGNRERNKECR